VIEDPDDVLVRRCRDGDRTAFVALVRRYRGPIYNCAYRVLGREEDASDVTQGVFLKVIQRLDQYDPNYKFFSWIYRMALNDALNMLRDRGREAPMEEGMEGAADERSNPEAQVSDKQEAHRIQQALMRMKVSDRAVLTLRHFSDCSYEEIAEIMELEVKTVKSRLFEARQRLRQLLVDLRPLA
jgi:RNA polymerase sigma-70 factor (ECF subfamily)